MRLFMPWFKWGSWMAKTMVIPVFIPHLGCGHSCVFCNQRKIAGSYDLPGQAGLAAQVVGYRKSWHEAGEVQLAFYGGSFTGLEVHHQERLLGYAEGFKAAGLIEKIRLSTRPDYIDGDILARLLANQVDIVELGVQSLNDQVLVASKRGHSAHQVLEAVAMIRQTPLILGLQVMVGLPGDTPKRSLETARAVVDLAPDFVRIYPTAVIEDTTLAAWWREGLYEPWDEDVMLDTLAQMVGLFNAAQVPIVRIGLQATDNLQLGRDLLAGAYHPAMGELVKGRLFRMDMEAQLAGLDLRDSGSILIACHPKDRSQVVGQKKCNLTYLAQKYKREAVICPDEGLSRGQVFIRVGL